MRFCMLKYLGIFLALILTSFFFFPVEFVWFPGFNTKTAMAGVGLLVLSIQLARKSVPIIDAGLLSVAGWALAVSFMSFLSITYNGTNDLSFVTYFISMCVWLCAAYLATKIIQMVHGYLSVKLVSNYLIAVCTIQCIIAFLIGQSSVVEQLVNSVVITGEAEMITGRLYGIGAGFDVAGLRFMAVLTITAYMMTHLSEYESRKYLIWYIIAFSIISLIGNMISRSTVFGIILGFGYLVWASFTGKIKIRSNLLRLWKCLSIFIGVLMVASIFLYQINQGFRNSMHYGFEGFFSLYEKGKWEVSSNKGLVWMWQNVKPEHIRTWIIGDGYCDDPFHDPYYTGPKFNSSYYMGTDVGYMRFIFYFGVLGTLVFIGYFCQTAYVCGKHFPHYKNMFLLILLCNFIGWLKVATDIFVVFAIFLAIILSPYWEENEEIHKIGA